MGTFEIEVLGMVSNDYEAIHTIRSDLERELARPVSAEEVASALASLAQAGLVDAFVFDPSLRNYRKVGADANSISDLWFLINSAGRAEYERLVA
jgi:hypothetical protein